MVCDGLLRQNEAFLRRRSTHTRDWGEERDGAKYIRANNAYGSRYSSFSPLDRAGKHPVQHEFKQLKHSDDRTVVFHHQVDSGNEAR